MISIGQEKYRGTTRTRRKNKRGPGREGEGNKGIRNAADGEMGNESERSIGIGNAGN